MKNGGSRFKIKAKVCVFHGFVINGFDKTQIWKNLIFDILSL